MGIVETYFFDTYALFEIIVGNKNYNKYLTDIAIITSKLNLIELHYGLLLKYGKDEAEKWYQLFLKFVVPINDMTIFKANEFRAVHKKKKLSYIDCIGYMLAKNYKSKFLTGDMGFEGMDNVEYVK